MLALSKARTNLGLNGSWPSRDGGFCLFEDLFQRSKSALRVVGVDLANPAFNLLSSIGCSTGVALVDAAQFGDLQDLFGSEHNSLVHALSEAPFPGGRITVT